VQRDGIRCHGLRYFSLTLAAFVGEAVIVRYDPRHLAEIRVFHRGSLLCRAVSPEIAAVSISLKDLQAARNQRRRELRQQLASRRSLVEILTHQAAPAGDRSGGGDTDGTKTPEEDGRPRPTRLKIYRED
jgi:putative transposase